VFIPEFKRLNVLLREFRVSRNHMAIVIDEYAGIAGLITIEDVLEQIVGEIEDEYDFDEADDNIQPDPNGLYRVKAHTAVADFNAAFGTAFSDEECNTVGGLILNHLGRVPQVNETILIDRLSFHVLRADSRRIYTLLVTACRRPAMPDKTLRLALPRGAPARRRGGRRLRAARLVSAQLAEPRRTLRAALRRSRWRPAARHGALIAASHAFGLFLTGVSWVYVSLSVFGGMPAAVAGLATVLFCAVLSLFPALAGALFVRLAARHWLRRGLLFAALWALGEWLRGWVFTGFPWLAAGYSQTPPSPLAGYAPLLGVYGVSLLSALLGSLMVEVGRRWLSRGSLRRRLAALVSGPAAARHQPHPGRRRSPARRCAGRRRPASRCRSRCCRATCRRR
jgi:hypothetical protein